MSVSGWIGVDLDGTLAEYHGWNKGDIGNPIPLMVNRIKGWLREGTEVRIVTARVASTHKISTEGNEDSKSFADEQRELIENWCEKHVGARLAVTCQKDFAMIELWDDRAVQVVMNTGIPSVETTKDILKSAIWQEEYDGHVAAFKRGCSGCRNSARVIAQFAKRAGVTIIEEKL